MFENIKAQLTPLLSYFVKKKQRDLTTLENPTANYDLTIAELS